MLDTEIILIKKIYIKISTIYIMQVVNNQVICAKNYYVNNPDLINRDTHARN